MFVAAAKNGHTHPDIVARMDALAVLNYRLNRRRFMLDFPDESPPPDVTDLSLSWIQDYDALNRIESHNREQYLLALMQNGVNKT